MKLHSHIAAILTIASFAAGAGQTFKMDEKSYVPFDATTKVTVECPDSAAAGWLTAHLKEWYGDYAPKVATGATGLSAEGIRGLCSECRCFWR